MRHYEKSGIVHKCMFIKRLLAFYIVCFFVPIGGLHVIAYCNVYCKRGGYGGWKNCRIRRWKLCTGSRRIGKNHSWWSRAFRSREPKGSAKFCFFFRIGGRNCAPIWMTLGKILICHWSKPGKSGTNVDHGLLQVLTQEKRTSCIRIIFLILKVSINQKYKAPYSGDAANLLI